MFDQSSNKDRIVEFGGFEVVYVSGERGQPIPEQAPAAFDALEAMLPTLRKKRFYGVVTDGTYRACVAVDEGTLPSICHAQTMRRLWPWPNLTPQVLA
jgi:hypothetical protein